MFAFKIQVYLIHTILTLSQTIILDSFKLKESADDNFKFDENGRKFSEWVENTVSNFSFSHCVFKRLLLQTFENQGLYGKGLKYGIYYDFMDR